MIEGPIVEEIRYHRKKHAEIYDNNLSRIIEALQQKEHASKHTQLNPGPKLFLKQTGS